MVRKEVDNSAFAGVEDGVEELGQDLAEYVERARHDREKWSTLSREAVGC
jgi:hypothetical protein